MAKSNSLYKDRIQEAVQEMEGIRRDPKRPREITLAEYMKTRWTISEEAFYDDIGVNPNEDTISNLLVMPDAGYRWLVPEIIRDAIRLGIKKAPIYPNIISAEQSVSQLEITMPAINQADATPKKLGTAETIPLGDVSFDQKKVKIFKIGRGIKLPDEVKNYVAINLVSIFMQDFGIKMGMGLDYLALNTAINGDQADGSDAAPVIGITTPYAAGAASTMTYRDILRVWFRLGRLGRTPRLQIAGEDVALDVTELYLATRYPEGEQRTRVSLKTSLPQSVDMYVHGGVPASRLLMVDSTGALIKLNAQPLLVETERIVSNQTEATYATITTGFATVFRDARLVIDTTVDFDTNKFGNYPFLDPTPFEVVPITKK